MPKLNRNTPARSRMAIEKAAETYRRASHRKKSLETRLKAANDLQTTAYNNLLNGWDHYRQMDYYRIKTECQYLIDRYVKEGQTVARHRQWAEKLAAEHAERFGEQVAID